MTFNPAGKRVTVMGLGRFGGGSGVVRWLAEQGAEVLVTDLQTPEALREPLDTLRDLAESRSIAFRLGEHSLPDFTECDAVVANPAVPRPWANTFLAAAQNAGVPITTEIGLVTERLPDRRRVVGVTGSAGKSTTAAMIARALESVGVRAQLGGNIGGSLLDRIDRIGPSDTVVLELSSAMLHWLDGWSPGVAVVTNLTPNHTDWHGSFEHYAACKHALTRHQHPGDAAILGPDLDAWPTATGTHIRRIGPNDAVPDLAIPGKHNAINAALAIAAAGCAAHDANPATITDAARSFPGLPHRLSLIGQSSGVRYYDDSKATTPEATLLALDAFAERNELGRVHLIVGGYDKGSDLSPIAHRAAALAGLYCIGATGPTIAHAAAPHATLCGTLTQAMQAISSRTVRGDIVLLSPGCASWDQFDNFESRGRAFAAAAGIEVTACS